MVATSHDRTWALADEAPTPKALSPDYPAQ